MSITLTPQQFQAAPTAAAGEPILDLDEIQGDVLIGLQKNFEHFLFFKIQNVDEFKECLKKRIVRRITTAAKAHLREFQLNERKLLGLKELLPLVGVNLGFTAAGLKHLIPTEMPTDPSFNSSAEKRAAFLGDPADAAGKPTGWLPPFLGEAIDGVFLVTGGTKEAVDEEKNKILNILGASVSVAYDETGGARLGTHRGHEHFGWLDGVSQPGIKGLTTPFPGQRLLDPGLFVLGYPATLAPPLAPPEPAWTSNGSYMVFRRLNQLVPEFEQFVLDEAVAQGMDPVLLGARLVGRWKSGAPMELTPSQDDIALGGDPQHNNDFDYADDQAQRRCPFGAHIRKANPREDFAPLATQEAAVDPRRILRAGIPFGPEVDAAEAAARKTATERGLMFVCYQTSIENQFEFVQVSWVNNPGFIFNKHHPDGSAVATGADPIIGQHSDAKALAMDEPVPNYPTGNVRSRLNRVTNFVVPTAGAYCFMPSISALENELSD